MSGFRAEERQRVRHCSAGLILPLECEEEAGQALPYIRAHRRAQAAMWQASPFSRFIPSLRSVTMTEPKPPGFGRETYMTTLAKTTRSSLAILGGRPAVESVDESLFRWPIVTDEDERAVLDVLRSGAMSNSAITREFEAEWGAYL